MVPPPRLSNARSNLAEGRDQGEPHRKANQGGDGPGEVLGSCPVLSHRVVLSKGTNHRWDFSTGDAGLQEPIAFTIRGQGIPGSPDQLLLVCKAWAAVPR